MLYFFLSIGVELNDFYVIEIYILANGLKCIMIKLKIRIKFLKLLKNVWEKKKQEFNLCNYKIATHSEKKKYRE